MGVGVYGSWDCGGEVGWGLINLPYQFVIQTALSTTRISY